MVGVEDDTAFLVARRAPSRLHERSVRPQEAFLVRVQNRDKFDFRQVQPLAEKVDAHQHVEVAAPQPLQYRHALYRVDVGVQVFHAYPRFGEIVRQIFGAAFRERRDEHSRGFAAVSHGAANLLYQVVNLVFQRPNLYGGVEEPGGAYDLLGDGLRLFVFLAPRRRGAVDNLVYLGVELVELQRAVVFGAREAEAVVDEHLLSRLVAVVHGAHLRQGDVAFVDDCEEIVREIVEEALRRRAGRAASQRPRIVLDAVAVAELAHHLYVVFGALAQTLRFQKFAFRFEERQTLR